MNLLRLTSVAALGFAFLLCVTTQGMAAVELTTNGDFETGDLTGWTQFPTGPGQQSATTSNPSAGTYAGEINNDVAFSNSLFKQANLAPGQIAPNTIVSIEFDARGSYAIPGGVAFAEFFTELSGGGTSSGTILGGAPLLINPDPNVWTTFNFTYDVAGFDTSGGVTLQLGATNGPGAPTVMYYDNVSVTVPSLVPEPGTFALAGLALAGFVGLGRRK